jgi:predicted SpoU family rRNA methylase
MGRNTHKPIAGGIGWLAFTRTFDFPVEVTSTLDVYHGDVLIDGAESRRTTIKDQADYFVEIGDEPSAEVAGALEDARRIVNDVSSRPPEYANRAFGPVRVAISADTPEKLASRVQEFISTMQREQQIEWVHPHGQQALLTEFYPCAGHATPGMQQQFTPGYLAAATPNAATSIGTPSGPFLGVGIGGSSEAFLFDPTWGHGTTSPGWSCSHPRRARASPRRWV